MEANYASATIAADRGQRSFGLSLDQFLAKRGASAIVARGRSLKQSQGALFASIQQRYGVPPGPLLAIWGISILVLVFEKDLGSSLLFFAVFAAMLYMATERSAYRAGSVSFHLWQYSRGPPDAALPPYSKKGTILS